MKQVMGLLVLLMALSPSLSEALERLVVATDDGKIAGFKEHSVNGREFFSFHSIPYAEPPVGDLRLKDPVASEGWSGVRDGTQVPPMCSQVNFIDVTKKIRRHLGSEDCLYLSVFTPMKRMPAQPLPVLVFIHGGAFFCGGISHYPPHALLNEDIVLVVLQYRLGVLGFLSTEDEIIPGNFGLKDQTLALRWVHTNIHHFGGDATRITIFGESAGGASVHYHLLSPHSHDYFTRAIMMSGTLLCPWAMGGAFREAASYTGQLFGCPELRQDDHEKASERLLRCLQNADTQNMTLSIMDHIYFSYTPILFGPRVDNDYLPDTPEVLTLHGRHKITDVMSGITLDEGTLFAKPLYSSKEAMMDVMNNFPEFSAGSLDFTAGDASPLELSKKIFDHYIGGISIAEEKADDISRLYGDRHFKLGHVLVSSNYAKNVHTNKIFLYSLNHQGQWSIGQFYDTDIGTHWISHADDLFYLFTGGEIWKPLERKDDHRMRNIMIKLWTNFAATGNPTPDDSLGFVWTPATADHLQHLSLTTTPAMEDEPMKEDRVFWETLPTKQNYILHPDKVIPISESTQSAEKMQDPSSLKKPRKHLSRDEL